jgi:ribosomal protein S18 acetylase RimI-like enzyme
MGHNARMTTIVPFEPGHRETLLALSIRAWQPVFALLENAVPPFVYDAFYPEGWRTRQLADLAAVLDGEPHAVDVALHGSQPIGWVCTRLHPLDMMGEIHVIVVDPEFQRRGVGRALMRHAAERSRAAGMRMLMVETGDDSGHAPARLAYEAAGFQRWPVARYFSDLDGPP